MNKSLVNYYELLPVLASSIENYKKARKGGATEIPARSLCRNFSHGFMIAKKLDMDWWVTIMGDVSIINHACPDFIKGLKYNYPQSRAPKFLRRFKKHIKS